MSDPYKWGHPEDAMQLTAHKGALAIADKQITELQAEIDVLNERNMRQKNHCHAQADEIDALLDQVIHMGEIMDRVANALKGVPPARTLHSTHDIAELTAAKVEEVRVLREAIQEHKDTFNDYVAGDLELWEALEATNE